MSDKPIQDLLNRRNTRTVIQTVNDQNAKLFELQKQIDGLRAALQTALAQVADLNNSVNQLRVQVAGKGRTAI